LKGEIATMIKQIIALSLSMIISISIIGCNNMENDVKQVSTNTQESQSDNIKSGVFFIGGEYNGTQYSNQSMVHRLGFENAHTPIVMLPGLGLSAYIYTSTPDSRNGWTADFAQAGFDTYGSHADVC